MRLLLLLAICVALFLILRRLTRPAEYTPQEAARVLPQSHVSPHLHQDRLEVIRHYFRELDAVQGPPDRAVFYDELFVDVLDPRTGDIWKYSFFVGTPQGVARVMNEENWDYVFSNDLLIVKEFDVKTILQAVVENLEEQHEMPGAVEKKRERSNRYWA